jgi:hypothetical protein
MVSRKFDKRLMEEVKKKKDEIRAKKIATEEVKIPVVIEHSQKLLIPKRGHREEKIKNLKRKASKLQKPIVDKLVSLGVKRKKIRQQWISNMLSTELTIEQLEEIAKLDEVKIIRLEKIEKVTCLNQSVPLINAPKAWNMGYAGSGVKIAILDTGIDKTHPALAGKVVDEFDTTGEGVGVPGDHGTHCAGIIASNDTVYKGVAYDASLINGKVLTSTGRGTPTYVTRGIQEAINRGADIISMSLGWSHIYHKWQCTDGHCVLCDAVDNAVELGVIVVVAAGNENNQASVRGADTNIRCPGNARGVITVGAMDKSDRMAAFSSRGPTPYKAGKPDVCAPGVDIRSTVTNGGWATMSGTSMACPHVAGLAALLLQKYPHLVCQDVKHILMTTALDKGYGENEQGAGRADALAAFKYFDPASGKVDVYVRDHTHDVGDVPVQEPRWHSPDIWVQLIQNGKESYGIVEPHTRPEYGQTNYVFVRIHNRGSIKADRVDVYLGAAGFSTNPSGWEDIGKITALNIFPGQTKVVGPFKWSPPKTGHGCFKVGLDYSQHPLRSDWKSVDIGVDNNIAQRNIEVADLLPNGTTQIEFYVSGLEGKSSVGSIEVDRSRFPIGGEVKLKVLRRYVDRGERLVGIRVEKRSDLKALLIVTGKIGRIEGIPLRPGEKSRTYMFATLSSRITDNAVYPVTVTQRVDGKLVGRITLWVSASRATPYIANSNPKCREVHRAGCIWVEKITDQYKMPVRSLDELRQRGFPSVDKYDGCKYCLPEYHMK